MLLEGVPEDVPVPAVDLRDPLEKQFVLVEELALGAVALLDDDLLRLAIRPNDDLRHLLPTPGRRDWLLLASYLGDLGGGILLSGLVGLGAHDVLDPVLHLGEVVSAPVEFLDADEVEGVYHEVALDLHIEGRIGGERGTQVDLHEPGLQVGVDQDVIAEELEAVASVRELLQVLVNG